MPRIYKLYYNENIRYSQEKSPSTLLYRGLTVYGYTTKAPVSARHKPFLEVMPEFYFIVIAQIAFGKCAHIV